MTPQDHATHLLRIYQQRRERGIPPSERLPEEKPRVVRVGDHDAERSVA